jgi:DNA-binding NtrC family response regulator
VRRAFGGVVERRFRADTLSRENLMKGVLVVDDMPHTRRLVRRVLDREGFEIYEADNGATAYAAARSHPDDIKMALVEVELPGAGGAEVGAALQRTVPGAHVVFITGHDVATLVADGRLPEGAVVLRKPFTVAALLDIVRRTIG